MYFKSVGTKLMKDLISQMGARIQIGILKLYLYTVLFNMFKEK